MGVMIVTKLNNRRLLGRFGKLAIVPMAMIAAGCSPEGAGTVDVASPKEVRAKQEEGQASAKPPAAKQAKAKELEVEAAKKNPKLH